jgi:predicted membrane protein
MPRSTGRYASAGLFILLGIVLLLFTTDVIDWVTVSDVAIPGVFLLLGVWALLASRFRNLTGPVMVVVIAGTVLLENLEVLPSGFVGTWWPALFVLLGLLLVVNRERRSRSKSTVTRGTDDVTVISVFGGGDRRVRSEDFSGGEVVSVFGGSDVDLRDATVSDPPAVLELVSIFGGAEVTVPEDWHVQIDILAIFGGTSDERRGGTGSGDPDLVLTGLTLFGGVTVRD